MYIVYHRISYHTDVEAYTRLYKKPLQGALIHICILNSTYDKVEIVEIGQQSLYLNKKVNNKFPL